MARHISAFSPIADRMMAEDRARTRRIEKIQARRKLKQRLAYAVGPTILLAMGATVIASAQSNSPFANQKKVNAWELPQANEPLPETATGRTSPSSVNTAPRLQLRTRSLDADSATAPPPNATIPTPAPQRPPAQPVTRSVEAPVPVASRASSQPVTPPAPPPTVSAPAPATPTPTPTPVTSATRSASASPSPYSSPLTAPPLTAPPVRSQGPTSLSPTRPRTPDYSGPVPGQSVPSAGYTYQPPAPAGNFGVAAGLAGSYGAGRSQGGTYGSVPRSSVNNLPSSVDNATDFTVHQVPPYYAPGQVPRQWQSQQPPERWVQSNNPTGLDYGYARPGETAPQWEGQPEQGQTPQGGVPSSGPFSKPYPGDAPYTRGSQGTHGNQGQPWGEPWGQQPGQQPGQPGPYSQGPFDQQQKPGFFNRLGGGIRTLIRGAIRAGVGARERNSDWEETFIGDADLDIELSTITQTGLEWGVHGQVRGQYDEGRKGFVRRLPDCPPTLAGCASITVPGSPSPASVRGYTSQFYTSGLDVAKDEEFALESAHLFLRSAYGDVTVGLDDGAAFLFSLGAPTLLNVGASNSPVDYTGLDAVKTVNDASGFAEKVTYTSPRLLGDQVGIGLQLGLSYAPDGKQCGVDYCVDLNDVPNIVTPDIQDIFEAGLAIDRTFAPGMSVEATGTYARGTEKSGLVGLDDLEAFNAGLELKMNDFTLGGSWLSSNQGVLNGDYEAYDVGLTWKPSRLGFTVGYGHAKDKLVNLKSDQFVGGVSWDFNERMRMSIGGQYADRETLRDIGGVAQLGNETVTAAFIEGAIRF